MKSRRSLTTLLALALALSLLPHTIAIAGIPLGGMTVAISPDGKTLVAGGDTRTLVILDPQSLEVKNRIWIETAITSLDFTKDGATLIVGDSADRLLFFKTSDWSKKSAIEKRSKLSVAQDADLVAGMDEDYQGASIVFNAVGDGSSPGAIKFTKGDRVVGFGLSADGKRLGVLYAEKEDPSEKKVKYKDIPTNLKDMERTRFQQENDGKIALMVFFEVPSGKVLAEHKVFYTTSSCDIFFQGEKACIIGSSGTHAMIAPDGKVDLFSLPNGGYGTGASPDQKFIMTGGMGTFSLTAIDPISAQNGKLAALPGFPEYFKGFSTNKEGPVYAATTAYRVVRIGRNGNVEKEAPIK